jgi:hypothetical protein
MSCRALVVVTATGLMVGACSTTQYRGSIVTPAVVAGLRDENPDDTLMVEVPRRAVAPGYQSGSNLPEPARLVDVAPDHATLTLSSEAAARVVSNDSVRRILVIHRGRGAATGAGIGAITGVAAALLVAAKYSDPSAHGTSGDYLDLSRGDASLLVGLAVGIPATVIGAALGAAIGNRTYYTFGPPEAARANDEPSKTPTGSVSASRPDELY